jgi:hypothetical protein
VGFCFLLFFVIFVSGVCVSVYYTCSLLCLLWVCWVRENFSGGPGHIFSVWDYAVWGAGPVQFYLGTILKWMAGLYGFSLFWLCCSRCGTIEMVVGCGPSVFSFFPLCCQLLWRAVVCGRILFSVILIFFGKYVVVFFSVFRTL